MILIPPILKPEIRKIGQIGNMEKRTDSFLPIADSQKTRQCRDRRHDNLNPSLLLGVEPSKKNKLA